MLLAGGGVTFFLLSRQRSLPAAVYGAACDYVDLKPLYRKLGVSPPNQSPLSSKYSPSDATCEQQESAGGSDVAIGGVTVEVQRGSYLDDKSGTFANTVDAMRGQSDQYPTQKLDIGDAAAVGPNATTDSGMEIAVHEADFLLTIEVDYMGSKVTGSDLKGIPRSDLDATVKALIDVARTSTPKLAATMA